MNNSEQDLLIISWWSRDCCETQFNENSMVRAGAHHEQHHPLHQYPLQPHQYQAPMPSFLVRNHQTVDLTAVSKFIVAKYVLCINS